PDENHGVGQTAADRPEQLPDRVEQILGHAAALEDQAHEGEERNAEQRVVGHDAPQPLRQSLDELWPQEPELDAQQREADADRGERKGHRVAEQQDDDQRDEHQRRDVLDQERGHRLSPRNFTVSSAMACSPRDRTISSASCSSSDFSCGFSVGSGMSPRRNAMRLMSSETPCTINRRKPTGTKSRAGQMISPPALVEISCRS